MEKIRDLKVPFGQFEQFDEPDRMRFLLGVIERDIGAPLKVGVGRFESVLQYVGLGGGVDDEIKKDLVELACVRNLLVHKLGVVDEQFRKACPWRSEAARSKLTVGHQDYIRYRKAVLDYSLVVVKRIEQRLGPTDPSSPV